MNAIAEVMFWAGLGVGALSLVALWLLRRMEMRELISHQNDIYEEQVELRHQIDQLKTILRSQDHQSDRS